MQNYFKTTPKPYLDFNHSASTVRWRTTKRFDSTVGRDLRELDAIREMKSMFFTDINKAVQEMLKHHPFGGR